MKDSHSEVWGNQRYSITETTHYVKLSFERDGSKLKNYQQLRQLEDAFNAVAEPKKKPKKLKEWKAFFISMYIFFGLFLLIGLSEHTLPLMLIGGSVVALVAYLHKRHIRNVKVWQDAHNKCWKKREQIMLRAEQYLD